MNRFIVILGFMSILFLVSAMFLNISHFDLLRLEKILAADGSFDGPAASAFRALDKGLLIAGLMILLLAIVFFFISRSKTGLFFWSDRKYLFFLLGFKLIICLVYISITPYEPWTDDLWFYEQAINLSNGVDPQNMDGQPTALWPIGYPLLLSIFFRIIAPMIWVGQIVNILLLLGITLVTYLLTGILFDSRLARQASLVIAFMPSQIFFAIPLMSDVLFAFLILVLIFLTARKQSILNTLLLGIVFGLSVLTKPVILFFPLGLATYWIAKGEKLKPVVLRTIIVLIVGGAILVPWQIRNYRVFGQFVLVSTQGGRNLWTGNHPNASGGYMSTQDFIPQNLLEQMEGMNEAQRDRIQFEQGISWILSNPIQAISLWPKKFVRLFFEDSRCVSRSTHLSYKRIPPYIVSAMTLVTEGFYYSLSLSFIISLYFIFRYEKISPRIWLFVGTILYFIIIHMPFLTEGRYHMPLIPLFAIVACVPRSYYDRRSVKAEIR